MKILIVALALIVVSFVLRFSKLVVKRIIENYSFGKRIQALEPILGMLIWVVVIFWSIHFLFFDKPFYNLLVFSFIILLLLSASWFFIKDFMAGIAFKVQNNYSKGDLVQFGKISGKIEELLTTHVSIYTKEGKLIKIPYSKLSNEIISQKTIGGLYGQNIYILEVPKKHNPSEAQSMIHNLLLNSPWRISNKLPGVTLKSENSECFEFEIQLETRNEKHFNYVVDQLKNSF